MHSEILTSEQKNLLPLVKKFSKNFGLVGGTAIALQLGHRRSIDFDLFTDAKFDARQIRKKIAAHAGIERVIRDQKGEYTVVIDGVSFTFFQYPFPIAYSKSFDAIIKIPDLLTLAAMKAYALGRRAKWKDYVDLYFIGKEHGIKKIARRAKKIFGHEFNEKLFRSQLAYFKDINYSETVNFLKGCEVGDSAIKKGLEEMSVS